jgi:nicotinamide riboside kinase
MGLIKKIVILGPESTGKSTLCEQLANRYNTLWVPEYARSYLHEHGMNYSFQDLLTIAKGQIMLEDQYLKELDKKLPSAPSMFPNQHSACPTTRHYPLFIDTNMYVMQVWSEFVFGQCHDWILHQIVQRSYDLYLLTNTDLPWVADELREYPAVEARQKLFHIYKDILINQPVTWAEIKGTYEQRLEKAIAAVDDLLARQ